MALSKMLLEKPVVQIVMKLPFFGGMFIVVLRKALF
jgi:hypothetical protein